jgi:hypothetical protein
MSADRSTLVGAGAAEMVRILSFEPPIPFAAAPTTKMPKKTSIMSATAAPSSPPPPPRELPPELPELPEYESLSLLS